MGYRSEVYLKTTTEGWLMMKTLNDSIEKYDDRPLAYADVEVSPKGNYKITFTDLKWYDGYKQVDTFMDMLNTFDEKDIPYSYIRVGEDTSDIEHRRNYPDDMPDDIACFEPYIELDDPETYEDDYVMRDGKDC